MATRPFEIKIADKDIKAILSTFKNMDDIAKEDMKKTSRDIANDAASAIGSALQATKQGPKKAIETTKPALAEFIKEQRPNDPEPIVWDVAQITKEFGAEIIDEIMGHFSAIASEDQLVKKRWKIL